MRGRRRARRKVVIRAIQQFAVVLALADAVLYFAAVRPVGQLANDGWQRLNAERHRIQEKEAAVARLETTRDALPGTKDQLGSFVRGHVPSRRAAFSRAIRFVERLAQQSGVQLTAVPGYHLYGVEGEPFDRMGIDLSVGGPFPNLLKFVHAVETASHFMLVRTFAFAPGSNGGALEMHMNADMYLSP